MFTPLHSGVADVEPDAEVAEANGIRFVDHEERPSVRAFFERWGGATAVLNGLEVRSVAHDRCRRLVLTGTAGDDDWPTLLASRALGAPALPHLVLAGPVFASRYASQVVRAGSAGQLDVLLSGEALTRLDAPVEPPSAEASAAVDRFLRAQIADKARAATGGRSALLAGYAEALDQVQRLGDFRDSLNLVPDSLGCERDVASDAASVFDAFQVGLSRCAMLRHAGWCDESWDTHTAIARQSLDYEMLFDFLNQILADLDGRTGLSGAPLSEEVTIVVFSEMGRSPRLNSSGGKDHWTFTSTMLIGAGVRGGQGVGSLDEAALGAGVDLKTGEPGDVALVPDHLGATLLALGDVDPGEFLEDPAPILAVMR